MQKESQQIKHEAKINLSTLVVRVPSHVYNVTVRDSLRPRFNTLQRRGRAKPKTTKYFSQYTRPFPHSLTPNRRLLQYP